MTNKQNKQIEELLKDAGYHEDELLMEDFSISGEVKSAREWAADALAGNDNDVDYFYRRLVEVQWDEEKGDWVRIEF